MGRLFWKFFFFIWLAQLTAIAGIGGTLWLKHQSQQNSAQDMEGRRPSDRGAPGALLIESAAATLHYGGPEALRSLAGSMPQYPVYAIDEDKRELLRRPVSEAAIEQAEHVLAHEMRPRHVRQVTSADGHSYLLFLALQSTGPGDRGLPDGHQRLAGGPPPSDGRGHFHPLLPMTAGLVASLIFAALLAWYFSKPIGSLRAAFKSVAAGNLNTRLGSTMGHRRDELADLGRDFDQMTGQLHTLMDSQRRLLHDVSHELRSPLARLQAAIGLARQQPDKLDSSMARIERESVRMDKLVGELLTLSRLEAGVTGSMGEDIHLNELIAEIVDDANFEAQANQRTVTMSGNCEVLVAGNIELLSRAIENVVRNAIKHTSDGSSVTVEAQPDAKSVRISVLDQGPGVREAELHEIFEPFFRSASATNGIDGHGLGLAIARRVVVAHGGKIQASNRAGGGLCVEIALPVKAPQSRNR